MKYQHFLIVLFLISSIFTACDVLDVEPTDKIPAEEAITNEQGLATVLHGIYDRYQSAAITLDVPVFEGLAADNLEHNGSKKEYKQVNDKRISADNIYVEGIWNNCYDAINRVNTMLKAAEELEDEPEQVINYYTGQAYFLRAYSYSLLVKFFGGVPIRTQPVTGATPEELNIPRASVDEVYQQIISDLTEAETRLESASLPAVAYAGAYAAKALMARTYLYSGNYTEAYNKAEEVITSEMFELESGSNYAQLYDETSVSPEIIWQIDFIQEDGASNALYSWMHAEGRFEVAATEDLYNAFDEDDARRDATIQLSTQKYYCNKYQDGETGKDNLIVLRLAEMYLISAEAKNEMGYEADGEAFDRLNAIRERAGLDALTSLQVPTQTVFRNFVIQERRKELAFEGHRFHDLVRTGLAEAVIGSEGTLMQNNWLFPIPQSELDTNEDMTQNGTY